MSAEVTEFMQKLQEANLEVLSPAEGVIKTAALMGDQTPNMIDANFEPYNQSDDLVMSRGFTLDNPSV